METFWEELARLYDRLDGILQATSRDCGVCGECCRQAVSVRVRPLEADYVRKFVQNEAAVLKFLDFAAGNKIKIWGEATGQCPFQEGALCSIYPVRPYSCRAYGHYDYRGMSILKNCVYYGHAIPYDHPAQLPLYEEIEELNARYLEKKAAAAFAG